MIRKSFLLGIVLMALLFAGCSTTRYELVAVTNNPIGSKVGEASIREGGIYQAAKNGGIKKIAVVEKRITTGSGKDAGIFIVVTGE